MATISFQLDCDEVQLQIWQSLWQDGEQRWYIQFPLAISPDACCFTVLRTLYRIEHQQGNSAARCTSALLPLELDATNEAHWLSVRQRLEKGEPSAKYIRIDEPHERQRTIKSYLYWIFFDNKKQYICFIDQARCVPNNLLMFSLNDENSSNSTTMLKKVGKIQKFLKEIDSSYNSYALDKKQFQVDFHPSLPLLGIAATKYIYLWDFLDGE